MWTLMIELPSPLAPYRVRQCRFIDLVCSIKTPTYGLYKFLVRSPMTYVGGAHLLTPVVITYQPVVRLKNQGLASR